ncbi:MAG: hypothetical protein J6X61_01565, partial [Clostridia bacterium]|nr:hypothetical protein [Clostridia bacterium]
MDEPNLNPTPETAVEAAPAKPRLSFTGTDAAVAWICLLTGYLFNCVTLFVETLPSLGGALFTVGLFTAALLFFGVKGKLTAQTVVVALTGAAAGLSLIVTDNGFLHFFAFVYAAVAFLYIVYCSTGSKLEKGLSSLL